MVWSRLRRYLWQAKRPPLNKDYKCWVNYFLFKKVENFQSRRHLRGSRLLVVGCSLLTQAASPITPPLPTFCANGDNDDVDDDDIGGWTTLTMTSSPLTSCILTLAGSTSFKRPTGAALFVSLSSRAPGPDDEMPGDFTWHCWSSHNVWSIFKGTWWWGASLTLPLAVHLHSNLLSACSCVLGLVYFLLFYSFLVFVLILCSPLMLL